MAKSDSNPAFGVPGNKKMLGVQSRKRTLDIQRSPRFWGTLRVPWKMELVDRGHSLGILAVKSTFKMPLHMGMVLVLCFFLFQGSPNAGFESDMAIV